ncbi:GntR family transcriptional regulator [Rubellimicrobium arenae]|uniref:GntR family transcriptional regulator n=1 Tax=Rubellimicrobium arenae TaxID=2817372 RepID=UPI001B303AC1|nr:GntR family transcriptional regulator [Rubellimicrobium arenae]
MKPLVAPPSPSADRLSDAAYRAVLEALFDRRVPAGAFVSQGDLVRITGSPVGPLRDALKVLEADGVLEIHPRSGIQFVRPGVELTRSTYQFRGILERAAVRVFAESAPMPDIARIAEAHHDMLGDLARAPDADSLPDRAATLETMFHRGVIGALDNRQIDAAYRRLATLLRIIRLDSAWSPRTLETTMREHLNVLDRCRARDPDGAEDAMRQHLNGALQRHLKVL